MSPKCAGLKQLSEFGLWVMSAVNSVCVCVCVRVCTCGMNKAASKE